MISRDDRAGGLAATVRPTAVLALLFTTGWAANHFAGVVPAFREVDGLDELVLAQLYGLYAVGLLPGLLAGGGVSDRVGRPRVVLPGAAVVLVGTALLTVWHTPVGLGTGRVVVGLGAGAVFSAGTTWMADRRGVRGATLAGVALTSGFAVGPLVSGALAELLPAPTVVPFVVSGLASALAVGLLLRSRVDHASGTAAHPGTGPVDGSPTAGAVASERTDARVALVRVLPIGPLVFGAGTIGVLTLPARLGDGASGPLAAGVAAFVVLGTGLLAQLAMRRLGRTAGTLGALFGAAGAYAIASGGAEVGAGPIAVAAVLLGLCYGLCLHAGLVDVDRWAPPAQRGTLVGIWYVATYVGFAAPALIELAESRWGPHLPLTIFATGCVVLAGVRLVAARLTDSR